MRILLLKNSCLINIAKIEKSVKSDAELFEIYFEEIKQSGKS